MAKSEKEEPVGEYTRLYNSFLTRWNGYSASERSKFRLTTIIFAVILILAASIGDILALLSVSLPFPESLLTIFGVPAALLVYVNILGLMHTDGSRLNRLVGYKESNGFSKRIRDTGIFLLIGTVVFVFIGGFLPYGLGGTLVLVSVLLAYDIIRRTPDEILAAKLAEEKAAEMKEE